MTHQPAGDPYRARRFRLVVAGTAVSSFGDAALATGLVWYVLRATGSASATGAMTALGLVVLVAGAPLAGRALDRLPRRRLLIGADVARTAVLLLAGVGAALLPEGAVVGTLFAVTAAVAVGTALFAPGLATLWRALVPDEQLVRSRATAATATKLGAVAGAGSGGALVALDSLPLLLLVDAATFAVSALCLLSLPRDGAVPAGEDERASLRSVLVAAPTLRVLTLVALSANLATALFAVSIPLVALEISGDGAVFGAMQAAYQGGMVVTGLLVSLPRLGDRLPRRGRTVVASLCAMALGYSALAAASRTTTALAVCFVAGAALILTSSVVDAALFSAVPEARAGAVFGLVFAALSVMRPVGQLGGGVLGDLGGARAVPLAAGATALSVALLAAVLLEDGDRTASAA